MSRGGKRINCGRKKIIGKNIKVKLKEEIIDEINFLVDGNTQSEKLRKCIEKGLILYKKELKSESN